MTIALRNSDFVILDEVKGVVCPLANKRPQPTVFRRR
jgi:hypothetical protein